MIRTEALTHDGSWRQPTSLARGMLVRSIDGTVVGKIDGAAGGWVVIKTGWIPPSVRRIAADRIRDVRPREVVVDLTADELRRYPPYLTDAELERRVLDRIHELPGLTTQASGSIWVCSRDGVVTLGGNVPSRLRRDNAVEVALKTPGVIDVVDRLVTDDDIEWHVSVELGRQPETRRISVHSTLGRIVLSGEVPSDDDALRALRIARAANGVRGVVDEMSRSFG